MGQTKVMSKMRFSTSRILGRYQFSGFECDRKDVHGIIYEALYKNSNNI
jgi:hypothetical protein